MDCAADRRSLSLAGDPDTFSATATALMGMSSRGASPPWAFVIGPSPRGRRGSGHVERLIGSIRRECLDHVVVFGEVHLRRILRSYADYHPRVRTHLSLDKDAPFHRSANRTGRIAAIPMLGGLHPQYIRI
jgi:hypothetical protein